MTMAIDDVLRDALARSDEDREKLLAALQLSLEPRDGDVLTQPEWDAAWLGEIDRRLTAFEDGRMATHSHDDVVVDIRAQLRRR